MRCGERERRTNFMFPPPLLLLTTTTGGSVDGRAYFLDAPLALLFLPRSHADRQSAKELSPVPCDLFNNISLFMQRTITMDVLSHGRVPLVREESRPSRFYT